VRMIRRRSVVALGIASLLLAGALYVLEPFETRYEGKTVGDWIADVERQVRPKHVPGITVEALPPNPKVIAAFGESAIPALRKAAASRQAWLIVRLRRMAPLGLANMMKSIEDRALRRCEVAQRWLQELLGSPSYPILPPADQTNNPSLLNTGFV
jgi:hypothetical protein